MLSPAGTTAIIRPDLAETFKEFDAEMNAEGYIGQQVLPTKPVAEAGAYFMKLPIEEFTKTVSTARASGAAYPRIDLKFEQDSYQCAEHGLEGVVDDRNKAIYSSYFDAEVEMAQAVRAAVRRNHEQRIADAVFNTTTWTGAALTTAAGTAWSTVATGTIIADVLNARAKVRIGCGLDPDTLICNWVVWENMRDNAPIIDRIKYTETPSRANITTEMVARVLGLKQILVAKAVTNSANEGAAFSGGEIWSSSYAMVCKIGGASLLNNPGIGVTFHYTGDGSSVDGTVETYRDESRRGEVVRVRHDVQSKILYPQAGHLISGV